ncbi:hypothetical protein GXW74_27620, partial [Roseomonas eburnea]
MDYERARRLERAQRAYFETRHEMSNAKPAQAKKARSGVRKKVRPSRKQEAWRASDLNYCIVWLMKLHGVGYRKAQRLFDATERAVRNAMMAKASILRRQ